MIEDLRTLKRIDKMIQDAGERVLKTNKTQKKETFMPDGRHD